MNAWPYWSDAQPGAKPSLPQEPSPRQTWWYHHTAPAVGAHLTPPAHYPRHHNHQHHPQQARYQPYQRAYHGPHASVAEHLPHHAWYHPGRPPPCPPAHHFIQQHHQQQQQQQQEQAQQAPPAPPFQAPYRDWPACHYGPPSLEPCYDQAFSQPPQLSSVDGVQSGVPTLTTPTLTPTTLRNIQQTFLQAASNEHAQPPEPHSNQAGFVPPVVHPQPGSTFISIDSKSLGGGIATVVDTSLAAEPCVREVTSGPPPLLPIAGVVSSASHMPSIAALSVSSGSSSSDSGNELTTTAPPTTATTTTTSRRMGGRRPNNTAKLSEEEEQKRIIRRERNKMAAARCRKRRLDQTMTLQEETERLEEKKSSLQHEITVLQQQREELEFLLATHKAVCTRASRLTTTTAAPTRDSQAVAVRAVVTTASSHALPDAPADISDEICVKEEALSDSEELYTNSLFSSIIPRNKAVEPVTSLAVSTTKAPATTAACKPHRPTSLAVAPLTELGVSIETPSAGLRGFNFDSMMDGGTGLTPVTPLTVGGVATGLTPLTTPIMPHPSASVASTTPAVKNSTQCSHQQRSNSSELSSPDSLTPKHLVSL